MKTPKRDYKQDVCPKCGSVVHWFREEVDNGTGYETVNAYGECCNADCDFRVKGLRDHDGWEDHQQEARWKRKNRDRQQRRIIAALANLCEQAQGQVLSVANCYYRLLELDASSAMGQDIEGS